MFKNIISLLIFFSVLIYPQITPIANLRNNNANGVPVDSGQVFTIAGIVTVGNELNSPSYLQDNTAGIAVFARGTGLFSSQVKQGDSVVLTAKLTHYRGLTQFETVSTWTKLDSNKTIEPTILTVSDILNQNWNGFEAYEGLLVRINNVTTTASGVWVGNTNYNITDSTGTVQLRITTGTNLVGQTIPSSAFDVIGALGQFKTASPYNSGYQILARTITDIVTDSKPLILLPIVATNIDTSSFKLYFETYRLGNTEVRYGKTTSLEYVPIIDTNQTKVHNVTIQNLEPATRYYYKVFSTNEHGTSESHLNYVNTSSNIPSAGTINIYFNYNADKTVAMTNNEAKSNIDFTEKLLYRINAATYSIDFAVYSLYNQSLVVNALKIARNRGVKVRIVYDNRTTQNSMQELIDAGFLVQKKTTSSGIMHNKFFVFDGRDANPLNDWVWTGSWNVSSNESGWINNVVEINDYALAQAYTKEFEEMWGSNGETPNSALAKFGSQKQDNTPHKFTIGGREVELYFSPSDKTTDKIKSILTTGDSSFYFSIFSFTRQDMANEMIYRKNLGATIRGIIDQTDATSVYTYIKPHGEIFAFSQSTTLHHKYCIVDASYPNLNPTVITGSHNWSNAAENDNDENTLIIKDIFIANQYMQEFKRRYNDLGGTGNFVIPITSMDDPSKVSFTFDLIQNYPNPFNPNTTIKFVNNKDQYISLKIYDQLGRLIKTIYDDRANVGIYVFDFSGKDVSSGVYYSVLSNNNNTLTKKMLLIK